MSGSDWLLGDVGKKAAAAKPAKIPREEPSTVDFDAVERFLDSKKDGEKLRAGIDGAASALAALKNVGLTGEALVLLVTEKCGRARNGSRISPETVQLVLEGLFRLGEYVR